MVKIHFINLRDKFVANRLFDKTKNSLFVLKLMSLFVLKFSIYHTHIWKISYIKILGAGVRGNIFWIPFNISQNHIILKTCKSSGLRNMNDMTKNHCSKIITLDLEQPFNWT